MKRKLIDVSEHNGVIDWQKVKNAGIDGAIIRCGYGSDYASQDDKQYRRNVAECERLGIPFGVYLYSYAKTPDMARSEAAHVLRLIKGHKLLYPVYYDIEEDISYYNAKANAIAFGDIIEKAGYWCGIYTWPRWFNTCLKGLERFTKWPCDWGVSRCSIPCDMWQYTDCGHVSGVGVVDMSYCYRDFPKEIGGKVSTAKHTQAATGTKPATASSVKYKIVADVLNVRDKASSVNGKVCGTLKRGAVVYLTNVKKNSKGNTWGKIAKGAHKGRYIAVKFHGETYAKKA